MRARRSWRRLPLSNRLCTPSPSGCSVAASRFKCSEIAPPSQVLSMSSPRVVVAGTGFTAVRRFMTEALPEVALDMIDVAALRAKGHTADVLLPAMSRIDGSLMDRIEGLRLIQQWGAGLEGVDIAAATERKIAVAN